MPRISLVFRISDAGLRDDLVSEFALHDDVIAHGDDLDGEPVVVVDTDSSPEAVLEVRSTVVLFDDHSYEVRGDAEAVIDDDA